MEYINAVDFKPAESPLLPKINQYKAQLCEWYISLDTETSWNHNEDAPKAWIYSYAFKYGDSLVYGRKPSELMKNLRDIHTVNALSNKQKMVVYIHNMGYDISYLKEFIADEFGEPKYLVTAPHKYITFEVKGFLFKCSYRLSGKSLLKWSKDLNAPYVKDAEGIDYSHVYYQDEPIPERYIEYQLQDVLTLDACVKIQLDIYKDTLSTIPLTATGYVRRDIRREFQSEDKKKVRAGKGRGTNRAKFTKMALNSHTYIGSKRAFHGGYTHINRFLKDRILRPSDVKGCTYIKHRDFRSHYPSQQRCYRFPSEKWSLYAKASDDITYDKLIEQYRKGYCLLINIALDNMILRKEVTMPMLQASKVREGAEEKLKLLEDNGRILKAKGLFTLWITEYELFELLEQYEPFEYEIREAYISKADYLPEYMIKTIDGYFRGKSNFKIKEKAIEKRIRDGEQLQDELIDAHINLMKSKAGLNSIYGCSATNPIHPVYLEDEEGKWATEVDLDEAFIADELSKFYSNRNNCMSFQYGLYTTALAQFELYQYIKAIGYDKVIYCDTDSIFYFATEETEKAIEKLNEIKYNNAIEHGAFIKDDNGNIISYDSFDDEGENIVEFKGLHSKCYGYNEEGFETNKGKRHVIIAGVTALSRNYDEDGLTRIDELGDLEELDHGKVFTLCGGTMSIYNKDIPHLEYINGHPTEMASSCIIMDNVKTVKAVDIYEDEDAEFEVTVYQYD